MAELSQEKKKENRHTAEETEEKRGGQQRYLEKWRRWTWSEHQTEHDMGISIIYRPVTEKISKDSEVWYVVINLILLK